MNEARHRNIAALIVERHLNELQFSLDAYEVYEASDELAYPGVDEQDLGAVAKEVYAIAKALLAVTEGW